MAEYMPTGGAGGGGSSSNVVFLMRLLLLTALASEPPRAALGSLAFGGSLAERAALGAVGKAKAAAAQRSKAARSMTLAGAKAGSSGEAAKPKR